MRTYVLYTADGARYWKVGTSIGPLVLFREILSIDQKCATRKWLHQNNTCPPSSYQIGGSPGYKVSNSGCSRARAARPTRIAHSQSGPIPKIKNTSTLPPGIIGVARKDQLHGGHTIEGPHRSIRGNFDVPLLERHTHGLHVTLAHGKLPRDLALILVERGRTKWLRMNGSPSYQCTYQYILAICGGNGWQRTSGQPSPTTTRATTLPRTTSTQVWGA